METLKSFEETIALGKKIGQVLKPGDVLLLQGDLGAGKTTFSQGLAEGLNIKECVNSPTFVLISEYLSGRLPLYHMDLYRIEEETQLFDLGVEDYFFGNGVCVVEWPNIAEAFFPESYAIFRLSHMGHERGIELMIEGRCEHIKEAYNEYFSL